MTFALLTLIFDEVTDAALLSNGLLTMTPFSVYHALGSGNDAARLPFLHLSIISNSCSANSSNIGLLEKL